MDNRHKLLPGRVRAQCKLGLRRAFEMIHPDRAVDTGGYTYALSDNLIVPDLEACVRTEFAAGAGRELRRMKAVHSSAALAVNAFAPLRKDTIRFGLAERTGLAVDAFEAKRPIANVGRIPPHLDVVCANDTTLVAIESKCTEYLSTKTATFSDEYLVAGEVNALAPWFAEMMRLRSAQADGYRLLDAAQLIKHAFGLGYAAEQRRTTLLYLFWEPRDAALSPLFAEHRNEIARFARAVAGGGIGFASMTYSDLWEDWLKAEDPRLREHAQRLRARYWVPAWAWEGASFDGETITDVGFHDDL